MHAGRIQPGSWSVIWACLLFSAAAAHAQPSPPGGDPIAITGFEPAAGADERDAWIPVALEEMLAWRLQRVPELLVIPTVHAYQARRELTEPDEAPPAWDRVLPLLGARVHVSGTTSGPPSSVTLTLRLRPVVNPIEGETAIQQGTEARRHEGTKEGARNSEPGTRNSVVTPQSLAVGPDRLFEVLDQATRAVLETLGGPQLDPEREELIFAAPAETPSALEYYARAVQAARAGDARDALHYLRRSLEYDTMQPHAQLMLADIQARLPGPAATGAVAKLRALRQLAQARGDRRLELTAGLTLGTVNLTQRSWDSAQQRFEHALAQARELEDPYAQISALGALADLHLAREGTKPSADAPPASPVLLRTAAGYLRKALDLAAGLHDSLTEAPLANKLALVYERLEEPQRALEMHKRALAAAERNGTRQGRATAWMFLGQWYRRQDRFDQAVQAMQACLKLARPPTQPKVRIALADTLSDAGDAQAALEQYEAAYAALRDTDNLRDQFLCLRNLAEVRMELGQRERAVQSLRQAIDLAHVMELPSEAELHQRLKEWTDQADGP